MPQTSDLLTSDDTLAFLDYLSHEKGLSVGTATVYDSLVHGVLNAGRDIEDETAAQLARWEYHAARPGSLRQRASAWKHWREYALQRWGEQVPALVDPAVHYQYEGPIAEAATHILSAAGLQEGRALTWERVSIEDGMLADRTLQEIPRAFRYGRENIKQALTLLRKEFSPESGEDLVVPGDRSRQRRLSLNEARHLVELGLRIRRNRLGGNVTGAAEAPSTIGEARIKPHHQSATKKRTRRSSGFTGGGAGKVHGISLEEFQPAKAPKPRHAFGTGSDTVEAPMLDTPDYDEKRRPDPDANFVRPTDLRAQLGDLYTLDMHRDLHGPDATLDD